MRTIDPNEPKATTRCNVCGREDTVTYICQVIGERLLVPASGNDAYGTCRFCHRTGTRVVIKIPEVKTVTPVGWVR